MSIVWGDLLSRRFKLGGRDSDSRLAPLDCAGVTEVIVVRAGIIGVGEMILPSAYQLSGIPGEIDAFFEALGSRFQRLGDHARDCSQVGDFVVTDGSDRERDRAIGVARHLAVLVSPERRTFLTATRGFGIMSMPGWSIAPEHVMGAYRVKPT